MEKDLGFLFLVVLNFLCVLVFLGSLWHAVKRKGVVFDIFQKSTMVIYIILVACQIWQGFLGVLVIENYGGASLQALEVAAASLFFMMVQSVWFRMISLREGDMNMTQLYVEEARMKTHQRYLQLVIGYSILFVADAFLAYIFQNDLIDDLFVLVVIVECVKLAFDQVILILFIRTMVKEKR